MNQIVRWSLTVLLLVGVIGGAAYVYPRLQSGMDDGNLIVEPSYTFGENTSGAIDQGEAVTRFEENGSVELSPTVAETTEEWPKDTERLPDTEENTVTGSAQDTAGQTETTETVTETESPAPVMTVPNFTVYDENGNAVSLSDYIGKPIVLNFWATWCGYCKAEMPDFNAAKEAHPDVQFLMINATDGIYETVESARAYIEQQGFTFTVLYDTKSQAVSAYGLTGYPATFFIDRNGNLAARAIGMISRETLEKGIAMIE